MIEPRLFQIGDWVTLASRLNYPFPLGQIIDSSFPDWVWVEWCYRSDGSRSYALSAWLETDLAKVEHEAAVLTLLTAGVPDG